MTTFWEDFKKNLVGAAKLVVYALAFLGGITITVLPVSLYPSWWTAILTCIVGLIWMTLLITYLDRTDWGMD